MDTYLLKEGVNLIEVYFAPEDFKNKDVLEIGWKDVPNIPVKSFKNRTDFEIIEYVHNDLVYSYDISNDCQKVIRKVPHAEDISNRKYLVASYEETLPTHRFPCTNDLNNKEKFTRIYYKFNNRIFFIVEKDENDTYTLCLRYNHAYNVDIDKMNEDWKSILTTIERSIYKK
jgi:hypothetical protein